MINFRKNRIISGLIAGFIAVVLCFVFFGQIVRADDEKVKISSGYEMEDISVSNSFKAGDSASLDYRFSKKRSLIGEAGEWIKGLFIDDYEDIAISAKVIDPAGQVNESLAPVISYRKNGRFNISLPKTQQQLTPGKYQLRIEVSDPSSDTNVQFAEDFSWGVLAFNVNKSVLAVGDDAYLQMAALDDRGSTLCNAALVLEITAPNGKVTTLKTDDGTITRNSLCGRDNVIDTPDYYSHFQIDRAGTYNVLLSADTDNGHREISDSFEAKDDSPLYIERVGPTRIFPLANYDMTMRIKAVQDYNGDIKEKIPATFEIVEQSTTYQVSGGQANAQLPFGYADDNGIEKEMIWSGVKLKAGDVLEVRYRFDAPNVSPAFFLLGPARVGGFVESRPWQIASDAVQVKAKTVTFLAGNYTANGTTGLNSNTNQTLGNFNFRLAEKGVVIKNAYLILEAQFESYANNTGNYTSHIMTFDSCVESCTAAAFTGTNRVSTTSSAVIAYDESESNQVRLLLDVTSEGELAAYTGNGTNMEGQVGFRFDRTAAINSISYANARLVITYTYDPTSENVTNTVYYPLDYNGLYGGTKATSTADDCVLNSTCPKFSYNMELPEYNASSTRLSQWFQTNNFNYNNLTSDITVNVNIQGTDVNSTTFYHESALSDQGGMPTVIFSGVSGYTENTSQQLEYRAASAGAPTYYLIGGEVAETYIASATAATSTRTVSFPIGVVSLGNNTATNSASVDVYFPENGNSTGLVTIKKAWIRLFASDNSATARTFGVATKVGNNPQTPVPNVLNYRSAATVVNPTMSIVQIIPASDYDELASANKTTGKTVTVYAKPPVAALGGISAELVITYTYTNQSMGYLNSLSLYGYQQNNIAPSQSVTAVTTGFVLPETIGTKTVRGGMMHVTSLSSNSAAADPSGALLMGADLSNGSTNCANTYYGRIGGINAHNEFYRSVSGSIGNTNNDTYNICMTNNGAGSGTTGANTNAIIYYTYQWENSPPTGLFNSVTQQVNGSGVVDLSTEIDDIDNDEVRAKLEYVAGSACNFASPSKATIDIGTITADFGTPIVDNSSAYQVGTSTGWIKTASGSNSVIANWKTKTDIPGINGSVYCVRLTANDGLNDQATSATSTIYVDNVAPTITAITIPSMAYRIGDTLRATVTVSSDIDTFSLGASTINNVNAINIQKVNNTTYTIDYVVAEGNVDRASGTIPMSIIFQDSYGNASAAFTSVTANTASIDAHAPVISDVSFPSYAYKIGDTLRATITVSADASVFVNSGSTINGVVTSNLQKVNNTTYTIDYVVTEGNSDRASGTLPISIVLADPYGNTNAAYTSVSANTASLDGHAPVISAVYISNGTYKIGSNISISIAADHSGYSLSGASVVNGKSLTGFTDNGDNTYSATYSVADGDTDRVAGTIPVSLVLVDSYGNANSAFVTPNANTASVDAHKPEVLSIAIPSQIYKIGDTIRATATVTADPGTYTLGTTTVNDVAASNLQKISNSVYTFDYTVIEGNADRSAGAIPVSLMLTDAVGQYNAAFNTVSANTASIDAHKPVISGASFMPSSGVLKIGDVATVTITADLNDYTANQIYVNGVDVKPTFINKGDNTYTVKYTVSQGDTDVADGSDLAVSIVLTDTSGNDSVAYTVADLANRPGVDAHRPIISNISFIPTSGVLKIGDTATATITADANNYTAGIITINGVNSSSTIINNNNNTYTVTYTVAQGDNDVADSSNLPVSAVLVDPAGNQSDAYTVIDIANRPGVDAHRPVISNVTFAPTSGLLKIGDSATITVTADSNNYTAGSIMVNSINVGATIVNNNDNTYTLTYLVIEGDSDIADGSDLPVSIVLVDPVGNQSVAYVAQDAANRPGVDAHKPVISGINFLPSSGLLKIGDTATATISADGADYTAGTLTINNENVAASLVNLGGNNYRVTYTVIEGDADVSDANNLPIEISLFDVAGNESAHYIAEDAANRPGVDANRPDVGMVSFSPSSGVLKIGDKATMTITADDSVYSASSVSINGVDVSGTMINNGNNTYSAVYTVTQGDGDIADSANLPVSVILADAAGNLSAAYNATDISGRPGVDAHIPVITGVIFSPDSGVLRIGARATSTITADGNDYVAGVMTINGVSVANTLINNNNGTYSVVYVVASGNNDIADASDLPVSYVLVDPAGNQSATYNTPDATNRPGIDANNPTMPGALTFNSNNNNSITVNFGAQSVENNFREYKVFYRAGSTTNITEADSVLASSTDANLGHIDFNGKSTTTISGLQPNNQYSFAIWVYDQAGNKASSTYLVTKTNTYPSNPYGLSQKKDDFATIIANGSWTNESTVRLSASSTDQDQGETISLYFELIPIGSTFRTDTSVPSGACSASTAYDSCASKVWYVSSVAGDYGVVPFVGTVNPTAIPESGTGYKWQVLSCDSKGGCFNWIDPGADPNFKIDVQAPSAPGNLSLASKKNTSVTLAFGASTTESNFLTYKVFYKKAASGVTEADMQQIDSNLGFQNYNNATSTTIINLTADTQYVFNIWAYDLPGNKTSATEIAVTTDNSSNPPTGYINSVAQKTDGSGVVDISVTVDDEDNNDTLRAKIEYVSGVGCDFSSPNRATIDTTPANITSTYGTTAVDNGSAYQVGTTTGFIMTSPGANTLNFDWKSKTDIPTANGIYCVRLISNDGTQDQVLSATSTVIIDNVAPTAPGGLALNQKHTNNLVLSFGSQSSDSNFGNYRIFYKPGSSGVTEANAELIDANLNFVDYNGRSTTTVNSLSAGTQYVFNIWSYDLFGNKASATPEFSSFTNYYPANSSSLKQLKADGATNVVNGGWTNENNIRLQAAVTDADTSEAVSLYFELLTNAGTFTTSTSTPSNACPYDASYSSCSSKIWATTSVVGNYSVTPFIGFVSPISIPDSSTGYKWRAMACDDDGVCSGWMASGTSPNFKVDNTVPTAPGGLSFVSKTANSVTVSFGASTTESNFREYKIFYKPGTSGVTENDSLFGSTSDSHLLSANFSGATSTTITGLSAGTQYAFNIWAYDQAGNKASSSSELVSASNHFPVGSFVSAVERSDASGIADISVNISDADGDNAMAKVEYVIGAGCNFASPLKPTLDQSDENATSTYGDAKIYNSQNYQIGSSSGWIVTASGMNTVNFDWLTKTDLPTGNNVYCLRLTANDGMDNQSVLATTTLIIDNVAPTSPGNLSLVSRTGNSLTLGYGAQSTESNFRYYKIFYKSGASTISEYDLEHPDANLNFINYNGATTTVVNGLQFDLQYSFAVYAYDHYGQKASSSQVTYTTNAAPTGLFNSVTQATDGSGKINVSIEVYDTNNDNCRAKIEYVSGAGCDFSAPLRPSLVVGTTTADYGIPAVSNADAYQVGTSTGWIVTNQGSNTVNFGWNSKTDIPNANGIYCLRLTVNDNINDQLSQATTTVVIDNVAPTAPGNLSYGSKTGRTITLGFGSQTTESNFSEYKIFYKSGATGVTEANEPFTLNDDANLGFINYNSATSTTIKGLSGSTQYVINIWAYDVYGNKATATAEVSVTTDVIPAASWREAEDTPDPTSGIGLGKMKPVRLRIAVANAGDWSSFGYEYRLQYAPKGTGCANVASWTTVPAAATSEHFQMADSYYFDNGDMTSAKFSNPEAYVFTPGRMVKAPFNTSSSTVLTASHYSEMEYALEATTNAVSSASYCFRVTNNDTVLDTYDRFPELTMSPPPVATFATTSQRRDNTGMVDVSFKASDITGDDLKAKIEYVEGAACNFAAPLNPTLSLNDSDTTATYGDPKIDTGSSYQIGTTTGMIVSGYGTNTVNVLWDTEPDIPTANGYYCLRLTVNDGYDDQLVSATTTVYVDHQNPTDPGNLTEVAKSSNSITLGLGTPSTDSNFYEYKIFYKEGVSGVTESDSMFGSSSDANLSSSNYNGATTTTITGLTVNKQYVFRIWAYDRYGNKASSSGEISAIIKYGARSENWRWYYDTHNETPTSSAAAMNVSPNSISDGTKLKLRLALREVENVRGDDIKMRLQYSTFSDFSSDVNFVGEIGSSSIWTYANGIDDDNATVTQALLTGSAVGATHNESGISTSTFVHAAHTVDEWEFTIRNNGASNSTTYYFRAFYNAASTPIDKAPSYSLPSLVTQSGDLTYSLSGLGIGSSTAGVVSNVSTTPNGVNFGTLPLGSDMIGIHRFVIDTNIGGGYQLFVYQTQDLRSNSGSIINPVSSANSNPSAWPANPYPGAFGYHTSDATLSGGQSSRFAADNTYAKFESAYQEVGYSPMPVAGDYIDLVYRVKVGSMQAAGDYTTSIVYLLVPTF